MPSVTLDLPADVLAGRSASPQEFASDLRLAAAIYWYSRGEVSQEKGAMIAGLSRKEFILALARAGVDVVQADVDELKREIEGV